MLFGSPQSASVRNDRQAAPGQAVRGDKWYRGGRGGNDRGIRRKRRDRYGSGCSRPSGRTLRNGALRRTHCVGGTAPHAEGRNLAERKSAKGDEGRNALDANRGEKADKVTATKTAG